jgi:hypothetical protein
MCFRKTAQVCCCVRSGAHMGILIGCCLKSSRAGVDNMCCDREGAYINGHHANCKSTAWAAAQILIGLQPACYVQQQTILHAAVSQIVLMW